MKTNKPYFCPDTIVIELGTDNMLAALAPYSGAGADGPSVNIDPDDGVYPEDALSKGNNLWEDE